MSADVTPETAVLYVPDAATHWNDTDERGEPLFELLDAKTGQPCDCLQHGIGRDEGGRIHDYRGRTLKPGKSLRFWKAIVKAVHADGSADLEIQHPRSYRTLFYPKVRRSEAKENHTWHVGLPTSTQGA